MKKNEKRAKVQNRKNVVATNLYYKTSKDDQSLFFM